MSSGVLTEQLSLSFCSEVGLLRVCDWGRCVCKKKGGGGGGSDCRVPSQTQRERERVRQTERRVTQV